MVGDIMNYINRNPLIICICGKAGSGKSTVGDYFFNLFNEYGSKVIVSPYTKYLKKYISDITGNIVDNNYKPRDLLQNLSNELIKNIMHDKDFFVRREIEDINFYSYFFDVIIIDDVRFPREIEILKEKFSNVISVGIYRNNYDNNLTSKQKNDITETSLDNYNKYDYIINNDNINELKNRVKDIVLDIKRSENNG